MHLSYDRAGALADISGTRWRQLEDGYRMIRGVGAIPEEAPPATLARMAFAVGIAPQELMMDGAEDAAAELGMLIEARARENGAAQAEAARVVSQVAGLTETQRRALEAQVAQDIRRVRQQQHG